MPVVANIALLVLKYQLVVVQPLLVFGLETMCILAAPAHPQAGTRIRMTIYNLIYYKAGNLN